MAKRLISVWLALTVFLFSSISICAYADSNVVQGEYFLKDIVVNGQNIPNYKLDNPVIAYNGYVYIAIDDTMATLFGFTADMDFGNHVITLTKGTPSWVDLNSRSVVNNLDNVSLTERSEFAVYVNDPSQVNEDGTPAAAGWLNLQGSPLLINNSAVYIPVNAVVASGLFGWDLYWNQYSGVIFSTWSGVSASNYFDSSKANYKAGLVSYIRKKNPKVSQYSAERMTEYFENYGEIYNGIDKELLMGMAESESTFTTNIRNSLNCIGLMQIMGSTGAAWGFSTSQLYDMKSNIQMGTLLMRHNLDVFDGNVTLAVTAYNYGEYGVKKGRYSTGYYNKVIKKYFAIVDYASNYQA